MKIKAGKRYVRRDGVITGALVRIDDSQWPLHDPVHDLTYTENGHWLSGGTKEKSDLVKEYKDAT